VLKITEGAAASERSVLRLEGSVVGPWVAVLRRSCEQALHGGRAVTLDCADVAFVDTDAVALFRDLLQRDVTLCNLSLFIDQRLREG
jgi:ABC-type transporter Mla MlaB component